MQPQPVSSKCIGIFAKEFLAGLQHSSAEVSDRTGNKMMARAQHRITASKFGLVIKRRRNRTSLAQLLYPGHWARLGGQQH